MPKKGGSIKLSKNMKKGLYVVLGVVAVVLVVLLVKHLRNEELYSENNNNKVNCMLVNSSQLCPANYEQSEEMVGTTYNQNKGYIKWRNTFKEGNNCNEETLSKFDQSIDDGRETLKKAKEQIKKGKKEMKNLTRLCVSSSSNTNNENENEGGYSKDNNNKVEEIPLLASQGKLSRQLQQRPPPVQGTSM